MKTKIEYLIPIILTAFFVVFAGTGYAQGQGPLAAQVDRTTLSTDETLVLTVTLSASTMSAPRPTLPVLQGFNIVGSSTSSQMSIISGAVSSQLVYSYRLQPYQTGDLVIDPVQATLNGQTFSSQPITIHVTQGTGASAPAAVPPPANREPALAPTKLAGQDFYVEAEVDNPAPHVGQQIVYTFRFYKASNLWSQPQYEAPSFEGFWNEHQTEQYDYQAQAAGRIYQVTEVQSILFPSVMGPLTIDPARLTIPGGFFSRGQTLQTKPVTLDVQPLPPGAPEGFEGAVGQFSLAGTLDTAEGIANEPLTWRVTLSGQGNLSTAPDPIWPEMPGLRDFESEATINTEVRQGQVVGSRVYERLLVPVAGGEYTIPALAYTYFDPEAAAYQTTSTEPIQLTIAPGAGPSTSLEKARGRALPTGDQAGAVEAVQVASDIRHLKSVPAQLRVAGPPLTQQGLYWVAWAFPVFGAVGYLVWQRRQRFLESNLDLARSSRARKKARKALAQARKQHGDAYSAAGQILTTYLSDKLRQPVAGLTHQALAELLGGRGIKSDLIERIQVLLVSSELGRFAPGADDADHADSLLQEVGILIDALDKALS
jgi:hypothetical protein